MHFKTCDNIDLYVKVSGTGIPCVFIHGGPGAWSYNFEALGGNSLEKFMKMIYFDQRGCGRSKGDSSTNYSLDRIIEDLEELRKSLNLERWTILAHSFGGIIAVNYANKYGKHIENLILCNCTLNMKESIECQINYGCKLLNIDSSTLDNIPSQMDKAFTIINKLIEKELFYTLQYKEYSNFIKVNEIDEGIKNRNFANSSFHNKEFFNDYTYLTKSISIPTLIIIGAEDYAIGVDHYTKFKFPNSKVYKINGKHVPYLEDALEFSSCIKSFLSGLL